MAVDAWMGSQSGERGQTGMTDANPADGECLNSPVFASLMGAVGKRVAFFCTCNSFVRLLMASMGVLRHHYFSGPS